MMRADDVLQIIRCLECSAIGTWLDGGWGVDALLGEETRPHDDLDLVVRETDVPRLRSVLGGEGFREVKGGVPWNFVLADRHGRKVDVHTVRFDREGNGLYGPNGLMHPAGSLEGIETVRGTQVRCKTAEAQMADRAGYEWRAGDYHDVRLLHERLAIQLPSHYDLPLHE
jgi:lincosamide nucleotidyltransferase A/C/D/E